MENLPQGLTYLHCNHNDFTKLDTLPQSLYHIVLGGRFNQPINLSPKTIKSIEIEPDYNPGENIYNFLKTITHLTLGSSFNQSITNLPNNITNIYIWNVF